MTWQTGKCEFYGEVCQYCGVSDRNYCKEKEMTEQTGFKITSPVFVTEIHAAGMTLRDHFAGLAMMGISACGEHDMTNTDAARWSYHMADAMMKAREGK